MIATSPSSWATAVPGRGVACISTSSAARVSPSIVTEPSGWSLEPALARRRHHGRDLRPEALAHPGQQHLHAAVDELRLVADELHVLDVGLDPDSSSSASRSASVAPGQREPQAGERLADLEPGLAAQRARQVDGPPRHVHRRLERLVAQRRELGGRPRGQVHAVGCLRDLPDDEVAVDRVGQEREDRRDGARERDERCVERRERRIAVGAGAARHPPP